MLALADLHLCVNMLKMQVSHDVAQVVVDDSKVLQGGMVCLKIKNRIGCELCLV